MKKKMFIKATLAMLIGVSALAVSVGCDHDHDRHDDHHDDRHDDHGGSIDVHVGDQHGDHDDH
jgi:hypothetical protein